MARKKPVSQAEKKRNKIERQRQRRNERKAVLLDLGVKNPSRYYNSEKAFTDIVSQRKAEIKREKKYQKEKQRQERNIQTLQGKGVHPDYINSLKRKSADFIKFVDPKTTPAYFEQKSKSRKDKPTGTADISPMTLYLAWWNKSHDTDLHSEISSFAYMTEQELNKSIEHNYKVASIDSNYKGGRLDFGVIEESRFSGMRAWYMTTGASTEGLNRFDLQQLLIFLATVSDLMNRDQSQEFYKMVLEIKSLVPKSWHEHLPEISFYEDKF